MGFSFRVDGLLLIPLSFFSFTALLSLVFSFFVFILHVFFLSVFGVVSPLTVAPTPPHCRFRS